MTVLMRARDVMKRPVVTLAGDDLGEVKDIVYAGTKGEIAGFTLNHRGLFAGPSKRALPWSAVHALGRDAVMVRDDTALDDRGSVLARADTEGGGGDVLGSRVLTDTGVELGTVQEVIVEVGQTADVVGYEITPTGDLGKGRRTVLIPLPDVLAASVEALVVPASAVDFVCDDLAGFGAAVDAFRARLAAGGAA